MHRSADLLVFSPTDLTNFLECEYLTHRDLEVAGGLALTVHRGGEADLLAAKGEQHERRLVRQFHREGLHVVRIPDPVHPFSSADASSETERAMRAGASVIHQGVLLCDGWR